MVMDGLHLSRDSIGDHNPRDSSMFVSSSLAGDRLCPPIPTMEMNGRFSNWKAHAQQAPNCPRYYNNYSLGQPRYFCKGCRRYWTKGGSLRNVPVGTGCRKTTRRRPRFKQQLITAPDSYKTDDHWHTATSSPEIDLAAVFARYLNRDDQSVSQGHHESSSPVGQEVQLANSENATEQGQQQEQDNYNSNCTPGLEPFDHGFILQTEDVFWSTTEDGSSPNWDPMAVQPLAPFSASVLDDQFCSVSTNSLLGDINWSCFDLAGYGELAIS